MILGICICFIGIKIIQNKSYKEELKLLKCLTGKEYININEFFEEKEGNKFEFEVFKFLYEYFNKDTRIHGNVKIPRGNKRTTEADLIVINENCIFIVESKDWNGKITGEKSKSKWNKTKKNNEEKELDNPIIQNEYHIKHFKRNIDLHKYNLEDKNIYSLIVFSNKSDIDEVRYNDNNTKVLNIRELKNTLDMIIQNNNKILSKEQIIDISNIIDGFKEQESNI